MTEREARNIVAKFIHKSVRKVVVPAALGLGLAFSGCGDTGSDHHGRQQDRTYQTGGKTDNVGGYVPLYAAPFPAADGGVAPADDALIPMEDGGPVITPKYAAPFPTQDAGTITPKYAAPFPTQDAGTITPKYAAPFPDSGPQITPKYAAPFPQGNA
jgi:hypothetical protein